MKHLILCYHYLAKRWRHIITANKWWSFNRNNHKKCLVYFNTDFMLLKAVIFENSEYHFEQSCYDGELSWLKLRRFPCRCCNNKHNSPYVGTFSPTDSPLTARISRRRWSPLSLVLFLKTGRGKNKITARLSKVFFLLFVCACISNSQDLHFLQRIYSVWNTENFHTLKWLFMDIEW